MNRTTKSFTTFFAKKLSAAMVVMFCLATTAGAQNVSTMAELQAAIEAAPTTDTRENPTVITVTADFEITAQIDLWPGTHVKITSDATHRTLTRNTDVVLFMVRPNASLVVENITIDGNNVTLSNQANTPVSVNGNNAAFTMTNGARLINNRQPAVRVSAAGTFYMYDGEISGNDRAVDVMTNGTFIMSGGKIINNANPTSTNDCGVVVFGGTFIMTGGEISGNTVWANRTGAGVNVYSGASFTVGGTAKITGNTAGSIANNVVLDDGAYINISSEVPPESGMNIGVTKTANNGVIVQSGANPSHAQHFTADAADHEIAAIENGGLRIVAATFTVTYNLTGGSGTVPTETDKAAGETFAAASADGIIPPLQSRQFKTWNTTSNELTGTAYAPGDIITMPANDLTLYAIWEEKQGQGEEGILVNGAPVTPLTVANIRDAISLAFAAGDATVTGRFTGAGQQLGLTIPANRTLTWDAEYSGNFNDALFSLSGNGKIDITESGSIHNSGNLAIFIQQNVVLELNGGTVTAEDDYAIQVGGTAAVIINTGTVENNSTSWPAIFVRDNNTALAVHGGTVANKGSNIAIRANGGIVFVTGGIIADGGISINPASTPTAYYTGGNSGKFLTGVNLGFTPGTNLFQLDGAPALTMENGNLYVYKFAEAYHGTVTANFPTGLAITGAPNINPNLQTSFTEGGNTVDITGTYNTITATARLNITGSIGRIPVQFFTEPFRLNIARQAIFVNGTEVTTLTVANIRDAIHAAFNTSDEVTVTGKFTEAMETLILSINHGKKLIWSAEYSGDFNDNTLVSVSTNGTVEMEITESGSIINNNTALNFNGITLTVNGGTIKSIYADASAIIAGNESNVIINSGVVENNGAGSSTILLTGTSVLAVHGGTIANGNSSGFAVSAIGDNVIYLTNGNAIAGGMIAKGATVTATAYYTGNNAGKFNSSWTTSGANQNLFRLDGAPALTTTNGDYTHSAVPFIGAVTASFPAGLTITGVTATPNTALHTLSGNTVNFAGAYNHNNITLAVTGNLAGGRIPVSFTTAAFGVNVDSPVAPKITSPNNTALTFGEGGFVIVTATGNPSAMTYSLTGAPTGVSIAHDGEITIANTIPAGTYPFTITASNGVPPNATQTFTLTVNKRDLEFALFDVFDGSFTTYTGSQIRPAIANVTDAIGGAIPITNDDYTIEYGANINAGPLAGSLRLVATQSGNFTGATDWKNFTIDPVLDADLIGDYDHRFVSINEAQTISIPLAPLLPDAPFGTLGSVSYNYLHHDNDFNIINGTPTIDADNNLIVEINDVSEVNLVAQVTVGIETQNFGSTALSVLIVTSEITPPIFVSPQVASKPLGGTFQVEAFCSFDGEITYDIISSLPPGKTIDPTTGVITTTSDVPPITYNLVIEATSKATGLSATKNLALTVTAFNVPQTGLPDLSFEMWSMILWLAGAVVLWGWHIVERRKKKTTSTLT